MFYEANPHALAAHVDASIAKASPGALIPKAVIAPHAGHIYSGDIAGSAYGLLARRRGEIKRVVMFGPNHRMAVRGLALSPADAWDTPFGPLGVDKGARDNLARVAGVTVSSAPFVNEHSLEVHLPFVYRALGEVEIIPVLVGQSPTEQVSGALAMLWGGAETAIIVSSDLSHFHDYETCRKKDADTAAAIERLQPSGCDTDRACGHFAIMGLLDQARRQDLRVTALDIRNSGDTCGRRDRVVGYGAFAFEYAYTAALDALTRRILIDLARQTIRQAAIHGGTAPSLNLNCQVPRLALAQRAAFVTLTRNGQLRGCRGSVLAHRPLLVDVLDNAYKSGFGDPRFAPITIEEVDRLDIHISVLSTPRAIGFRNEDELVRALRPDIDGLIIRDGNQQSLFLPSVWEQIPDSRNFLRHLKAKAGLKIDHWSPSFEAYRFVTESFGSPTAATVQLH